MHAITEQELSNDRTKDKVYSINWNVSGCSATEVFPKVYRTQGVLQCATEHITHSPPNIMAAQQYTVDQLQYKKT